MPKTAWSCSPQDQVFDHGECLTHGLAGHGGRLRAVPSKPSGASVSLKRRVALNVTSGSFAFKMPSQNLTQNFL